MQNPRPILEVKSSFPPLPLISLSWAIGALLAVLSCQTQATTYTWNGAGANNNCTNPTNWVGGAIVAGNNDYVFGATSGIGTNINWDFGGGANPRSITFSSGAPTYNITGNTAQFITVGIDEVANSSSSPQTLSLTGGGYLQVFYNGTKNFNANAGNLTISGVQFRPDGMSSGQNNLLNLYGSANGTILNTVADNGSFTAGEARNLQKSGTGTWTINGAVSHGGAVTVTAGTLQLNANCTYPTNTLVSGGTLILNGPGSASTGVLKAGTGLTLSSGATVQLNKADEIGYGAGALAGITNNGGTITTLGGTSFRVTLPPLTFTGGTLTAGAGNNGDSGGNYLLGEAASTTIITVNAASSAVLVNPPAGVSIYAGSTLSVARGTAAADLIVSTSITNWTAQTGSVTISGTGTTVFNGTNTYTGTTTVSGGKLLQAAATTGGGTYSVSDGATLGVEVVTSGNTLGLSALTLGSSTGATNEFDFFGSAASTTVAAMTVTNALTVAGTSKINIVTAALTAGNYPLIAYGSQAGSGTLTLGTIPARSTMTLSNDTVHKIYYLVVGTSDSALTWTGATSTNWDTSSLNWTNVSLLPTNYVDNAAVTFNDNSSSNNVALAGAFSPGSVTVNTSAKSYTFSGAGKLTGITGLTKSGSTTLTLGTTGPNDFSGPVAVNGGTLSLNNGSQITAASGISVASGATLNFANNNTYGAIPVTINGTGASGSHGALDFNGGNNWTTTYLGPIALAGNAQIGAYGGSSVASPNVLNLPGAITGNYNLTFYGQGGANTHSQQINLSSAGNTWSGSTTVANLASYTVIKLVGGDNRLPTTTTVNLNATWFGGGAVSSIVDLYGNNQTLVGLNGSANNGSSIGNNIVQNSGNGYGGYVNLTINGGTGTDSTFNGTLGATGANNFNLVKSGVNNFTLGGTNTFNGSVSVSGGTLKITNAYAIQYASGVTVASGAALRPIAAATYASTPVTITGTGNGLDSSQGALDFHSGLATSHVWPGTVTLNGNSTIGSYGVTMRTTLSGPINGSGNLTIQAQGGSAVSHTAAFLLGANSTYSGNSTFSENGGLLWFAVTNGVANALPPATALTLQSGNTVSTYDLNGFSQTLAGLTASTTGSGTARLQNSSSTAAVLTISNTASDSYSGFLGGTSANNFSLVKLGAGTLTLSGANSYSGPTTISNGMVSIGADNNLGSAPGSFAPAAIALNAATLQGNASFTLNANRGITLGPTNLAGTGTIDVSSGATLTYGGVITNGGSGVPTLTKANAGTLSLTNPNVFNGNLFVNAGSLALSGSASISNAPNIYVNTNGTFDVSALTTPFSLTGSQGLAGFGVVTGAVTIVSGTTLQPGTNSLAGTMSFSNALTLNGNTLAFAFSTNSTAGGGTNSLIQMSGGTLTLSGTVTIQPQLLNGSLANAAYTLVQGAGAIVGGPANLHLNLATRQTITFDTTSVPGTVLMIVGGAVPAALVWAGTAGNNWDTLATLNWTNGGTVDYFYTLDNVTFNDAAANGNVALTGAQSPGSVTFSNNSTTYTLTGGGIAGALGGVSLNNSGTVNFNNTNTYTGPTVINAGTLKAGAVNALSAGSALTISNGTLNLQTYNQSVGAVNVVNGNLTGSGAVIVAPSFLVQTGAVSAALGGAATLTKASGGTVTLTGANTNTGATSINAGTLVAGAANALSAGSTISVVSNATLNIQGNNQSAGAVTLVNGTIAGSGGTLTVPSFLVQTGAVTAILAGGSAPLTKSTTGTVILDANNTFGGGITMSGGTLQVGNSDTAGTLGLGSVNVTNSGTTISFNRTDAITVNNTIQDISAGGTLGAGGSPNLVFNSGTVTLGGSGDNNSAIATVNNGGTLILAKTSSASVHALSSGLTIYAGGLIQLGGSGGDQISNSVTATMNGGTFDMAGQSETIGSFVGYGVITNSGAAATVTAGGGTGGNSAGALFASGGTLSLVGGTVTVGGTWNNQFGVAGGAVFNQTGGTVNSGSYFAVGNGYGSGYASMTMSGGTFVSASEFLIGFQRPGNFTLSGTASMNLNYFSFGDGTVYYATNWFNGGTVLFSRFNNRGSSPATLYFNGTTFRASATQSGWFAAAANINALISTNGLIFDSQANSVTATQPLLHDPALGATADGGLTKSAGSGSLVLAGTNTYTGNTIIAAGTLALTGTGSIASSPSLVVSGGATFDVSALTSAFLLGSGQTLSNSAASARLNCGANGFNTVSGTLSLSYAAGTPALNVTNGTLTLSGSSVFTVNNTSAALGAGSYKLISKLTGGAVAGSLPTVSVTGGGTTSPAALAIISGELYLVVGTNTLNLVSSPNLTNGYLDNVTFTATVQTNGVSAANATGTVQFQTNGAAFGGPVGLTAGAVSTNLNTLPRGTNLITAIYSGDANYLPSTNRLNQIVTNHPPAAALMTATRLTGQTLKIALSDIATNWSDADGDAISLTGINLTTTNGITLIALNLTTNLDGSYVTTNAAYLGYVNSSNVADQVSYTITDSYGGATTGYVNIMVSTNAVFGQQSPQLTADGSGHIQVTFFGVVGYTYIIQRSPDLSSWTDISTNTATTGNPVLNITDTISPSGQAYYRLKWQP